MSLSQYQSGENWQGDFKAKGRDVQALSLVTPVSDGQSYWCESETGEGRPITTIDLGGAERSVDKEVVLRSSC